MRMLGMATFAHLGWARQASSNTATGKANTVLGSKPAKDLGTTLMHEHVVVDFRGADAAPSQHYDREEAFRIALPHLKELRATGCRTLVDCTPAFLGRDVILLKRLSQSSSLNIVTNTGFYAAGGNKYLPRFVFDETADQLAARWVGEFRDGIEGTGVRPGIIKIGMDKGPLSDVSSKLARAAARTHVQTGLTIASHSGDGVAVLEQLEILREEGVHASAFVWVHAQNELDRDIYFKVTKQGAWIEFDGINAKTAEEHSKLVQTMARSGFLEYTLISQDSGWYHIGEPGGGEFHSYSYLFAEFIPILKRAGIAEDEIGTLLVENPKRALSIHVKRI